MQTILIELTNDKALNLLREMEALNLIKLVSAGTEREDLADKYFGKLSNQVAEEAQEYIKKSREEWDKDI